MPDIATTATFLGSIKTATELAKAIKGADLSLEKAEIKLKMADLISALADAKIQAAEIQDLLQEKDEKIKELKEAIEIKVKLVRFNSAYYEIDENDNAFGDAFCSHCWEINHKAVHLHETEHRNRSRICPFCKNEYDRNATYPIKTKADLK